MIGIATAHLFSLTILWFGWRWQQLQQDPVFAEKTFIQFLSQWDGEWYLRIVESGYPTSLPIDSQGDVLQNPWAFFPGYPLLIRFVSQVTHAEPSVVGILINQVAVVASGLLILDIARRRGWIGEATGLTTALFIMPAAPVFWMLYSEALFMLIVLAVLDLLIAGRNGWTLVVVPLAVVTRSAGMAVAATVAIVLLWRWYGLARVGSTRVTDLVLPIASVLMAGIGVIFWPLIAYLGTGRLDTLQLTYGAWNVSPSLGVDWLPFFQSPYEFIATVAVILAASVTWGARGRLGFELLAFGTIYLGFLLVASAPGSSTIRYVLLVVSVPFALGRTVLAPVILLLGIVAQFWWVFDLVVTSGSGGPPP